MTGQVVTDRTDPWYDYSTGISDSEFFPVYFYFLILLVMTNIGLRLCFYMYEVIFTMSASVNIISSYALGRRFLSVLYKKEYIIQYCKINFTNLLVKKFKSSIIFYFSAQLKNDSLRDLDPNGK